MYHRPNDRGPRGNTTHGATLCGRDASDGRVVNIEFEDNGRGMKPKERRKAFLPGYTTKQRGWGLGLAFVKRIVEEYHRGQVYIKDSVPRQGTTIQLLLPTT